MQKVFRTFFAVCAAFTALAADAQMREIKPLFPCTPKLSEAYGLCSHITRRSADFDLRHGDLALARKAGARWIRSDFDYSTVFPQGIDHADNAVFDAVTASCDSAGVNLLPIIVGSTDKGWAWDDMFTFMRYVGHVAERYNNKPAYWEIINEINLRREFNVRELAANYASALRRASFIIRKANPSARIVFGGTGEVDSTFLSAVFDECTAPRFFDIMNFHSYNSPEELPRSFNRLDALMKKYRWRKPVWLTETGFSTPPAMKSHEGFWRELVPYACKRLGLKQAASELAVVCDPARNVQLSTEQGGDYFSGFRRLRVINCDSIAALNPAKTPFLLAAYGEFFPKNYVQQVADYVRRGGTLICPNGVPFYYDMWTTAGFVSSGTDHHAAFHLAFAYWWDNDAKRRGLPEIPTWKGRAEGVNLNYEWKFSQNSSARYLDTRNLRAGDEFIPLLMAGTERVNAPVAGIYKLRSNMKGNIIIQTRIDSPARNEIVQAQRVARAFITSFAYGIDKVFWYHLRAFEKNPDDWESYYGIVHKDFAPKPAFTAYETLTCMLPDNSTRPRLKTDGKSYRASWTRPDKAHVTAVWSLVPGVSYKVKSSSAQVYDHLGQKVTRRTLELGAGVFFVVNNP